MKKKILTFLSYVLVAALSSGATFWFFSYGEQYTKLEELEDLIESQFVEEVDVQTLRDAAAEAMIWATGDQWSYYIPASQMQSYEDQSNNAYVGVGITIQLMDGEGILIREVTEGGPAQEAGLKVEDVLIRVEETDVRQMTVSEVKTLVIGEAGTFVELTVLREGEELSFAVERRKIRTVVAQGQMLTDTVGLVTIENFDARCAEETLAAIEALLDQGARKLIFDVRNNPGGYVDELVKVLDYLLPEGEIFRMKDTDGAEEAEYSDESFLDMPMAVLVNSESYSAAEFFAAALQEYEAAQVVGEKTCGKGYFQYTYYLQDGSGVALSSGWYYTPQGRNLAGVGVTPDETVEVDEDTFADIYYGYLDPLEDPQILKALEILG